MICPPPKGFEKYVDDISTKALLDHAQNLDLVFFEGVAPVFL